MHPAPVVPGSALSLDIEKAVAGGRMLARHEGRIVLVWGAIPGERVQARVDRVAKGVVYATTTDVLDASPDRRAAAGDWRCGGSVYSHAAYPRQLQLKGDVIADALARIGRMSGVAPPRMIGSPEVGYRMRARLHVRGSRIGFFREESHELCDAAATGQLRPETSAWIDRFENQLRSGHIRGVAGLEIAENAAGTERVCHVEILASAHVGRDLATFVDPEAIAALGGPGVTGLTAARAVSEGWDGERASAAHGDGPLHVLSGMSTVADVVHVSDSHPQRALRLRRDVRSFFQGNRFLLEPLVRHVLAHVPVGPVLDLYAGVGLFGLSVAAARDGPVTLVEGDSISGADLLGNAEPFGTGVVVHRMSVERFLALGTAGGADGGLGEVTVIVDPPRTGMTREVVTDLVARRPGRIVFISCDPATLARDMRTFREVGYVLVDLTGFDLFPNTAHIETVAVLTERDGLTSMVD